MNDVNSKNQIIFNILQIFYSNVGGMSCYFDTFCLKVEWLLFVVLELLSF